MHTVLATSLLYLPCSPVRCSAQLLCLTDRISLQAICRVCNNHRGTELFVRC